MTASKDLNFLVIGPQRTATSWLDVCLRSHPELNFPVGVKETFYWDRNINRPIDWYWAHFSQSDSSGLFGEVGSTYFHCDHLPSVLQEHNPFCKIIVTLRHPRERVVSLWRHLRRVGLVADGKSPPSEIEELFTTNFYELNLERWLSLFPMNQILILVAEDFESAPDEVIGSITRVLGVRRHQVSNIVGRVNEGVEARSQVLSNVLYRLARIARRYRFHALVEIIKKLGKRKIIAIKKDSNRDSNRYTSRAAVEYQSDILYVERMLERNLDIWRV